MAAVTMTVIMVASARCAVVATWCWNVPCCTTVSVGKCMNVVHEGGKGIVPGERGGGSGCGVCVWGGGSGVATNA
jgi:hypothetical protein